MLWRLQLPELERITPLPEQPAGVPTQPLEQEVDWVEVEAAVAEFDGQRYFLVPQPPTLQEPEVLAVPQHIPFDFAAPPPMPPVNWAEIAGALFSLAERQNQQHATYHN